MSANRDLFGYVWLLELQHEPAGPSYYEHTFNDTAIFTGRPYEAARYPTKEEAERNRPRGVAGVKAVQHFLAMPNDVAFDRWVASGGAPYIVCGPPMLPEIQAMAKEVARVAFTAGREWNDDVVPSGSNHS